MDRNKIHNEYAFRYAYTSNGDYRTVNAFTDGFESCERRINLMKPTDILGALIRSFNDSIIGWMSSDICKHLPSNVSQKEEIKNEIHRRI